MQIRNWDKQRETVFLDRYAMKDETGKLLEHKPEDMWYRVTKSIATNKEEEQLFLKILKDFRFVPGGRVLAGAGTKALTTYFNCNVIPITGSDPNKGRDSRHSIMETMKNVVEANCRGGGVGINWSVVRPKGAYVKGVNGRSSGTIGWARSMDALADQVEQGGSREAALMFVLHDWHADLLDFIDMKKTNGAISNANISIAISHAFLRAVENDEDWDLIFPDTSHEHYNRMWDGNLTKWKIENGFPVKVYKTMKAREIWDKICGSAWESGEPGVIFLDRCNEMSNTWYIDPITAVNVCGEQPLGDWGVCNLGAVNLVAHVKEDGTIDEEKLWDTTQIGIRFLDNVIDIDTYIHPEMEKKQKQLRRIGLGTMGLADTFLLLGIKYGSKESLEWIERYYTKIRNAAYMASIDLAKEKGAAPAYQQDPKRYLAGVFVQSLPKLLQDGIGEYGIRNMTLLTQAPTGTTSILAGVSSGIEPIFSWSYTRNDNTGNHIVEHPLYSKHKDSLPDYFVTAHDLTPEEHLNVQAVIQKYVDSSISKTINAPKHHSKEEVKRVFELAYEKGCKGITYYRDSSREGVLIKTEEPGEDTEKPIKIENRPKVLNGQTIKQETPLGSLLVTLNRKDDKPFETICQLGKNGSDVLAFTEALGRMISIALRAGIDIKHIIHHLSGIGGASSVGFGPNKIRSVPDAVAHALSILTENGIEDYETGNICPSCGVSTLVYEEGCVKCYSCDFTNC